MSKLNIKHVVCGNTLYGNAINFVKSKNQSKTKLFTISFDDADYAYYPLTFLLRYKQSLASIALIAVKTLIQWVYNPTLPIRTVELVIRASSGTWFGFWLC